MKKHIRSYQLLLATEETKMDVLPVERAVPVVRGTTSVGRGHGDCLANSGDKRFKKRWPEKNSTLISSAILAKRDNLNLNLNLNFNLLFTNFQAVLIFGHCERPPYDTLLVHCKPYSMLLPSSLYPKCVAVGQHFAVCGLAALVTAPVTALVPLAPLRRAVKALPRLNLVEYQV